MKKRMIAILLALCCISSLVGCGNQQQGQADQSNQQSQSQTDKGNQNEDKDNGNSSATDDFLKTITAETAEAKGVCGADLTWYYQDNVLVIKGTGDMSDYSDSESWGGTVSPWFSYNDRELADKIGWVIIDDGVTSIGECAFYECSALSKVVMGKDIKSIGDRVFYNCKSLVDIKLSESLETIGDEAFSYCESLEQLELPGSLKTIDISFRKCENLTQIKLNEGIEVIERLWGIRNTELTVPASVRKISNSGMTFGNATNITFMGDAPEMGIIDEINDDNENIVGIRGLHCWGRSKLSEITIKYHGSGFEPYIEKFPEYNWIKQ